MTGAGTMRHWKCPAPTEAPGYQLSGERVPLYIRRPLQEPKYQGSRRMRVAKRTWQRIGEMCLDCGQVEIDQSAPSLQGRSSSPEAIAMVSGSPATGRPS